MNKKLIDYLISLASCCANYSWKIFLHLICITLYSQCSCHFICHRFPYENSMPSTCLLVKIHSNCVFMFFYYLKFVCKSQKTNDYFLFLSGRNDCSLACIQFNQAKGDKGSKKVSTTRLSFSYFIRLRTNIFGAGRITRLFYMTVYIYTKFIFSKVFIRF